MIERLWRKSNKAWWNVTVPWRLRAAGVELGSNVTFYGMPLVTRAKGSRIIIGDNAVLCSDSRFTALGVHHPVILRTLNSGAVINIGRHCGISGGTICAAVSVEIGDECLIGANVTIVDTDFHPTKPDGRRFNSEPLDIATGPIQIERNVFIGTGTIILKGVKIAKNSVVGAGSVVIKNVNLSAIVAGVPALQISSI
jgi:acetyltransferase-like isoleucine patch superfamily enzyme